MKKTLIIGLAILLYVVIYKTYLIYLGEIINYIINPLAWIVILFVIYFGLGNPKPKGKHTLIVMPIVTVSSLIYIICYYSFGLVIGYSNNPFATNLNGIIINTFSIWFVICVKEYIRYVFLQARIKKYKRLYFSFIFVIFFLSDISFMSVFKSGDMLDVLGRELLIPVFFNLFMMYLSYVSDYKSAIISRSIIIFPSLLFSIIPNYDWFIIILFNLFFCLFSYLIIHYFINKKGPDRLIGNFNVRKWVTSASITIVIIAFGLGFFNWKPVIILTGSMEPMIKPGDMIVIKKIMIEEIVVGDVIEFKTTNYNIVHRVIKIIYDNDGIGLVTKGDANRQEDNFLIRGDDLIGKMMINIPYAGYPSYLIRKIVNNIDDIAFK